MDDMANPTGKGGFVAGQDARRKKGPGRKAVPEEIRTLLQNATLPAIQTVIDIMEDEETPLRWRLKAAEIVIERSLGKAVQPVVPLDDIDDALGIQMVMFGKPKDGGWTKPEKKQ